MSVERRRGGGGVCRWGVGGAAGWVGFPGSTGSNFFDCLVADRVVAPPELATYDSFNERLLYMP